MNTSTTTVESVEAWPVPEHARIGTLPRHFGMHMLTVEGRIYDFLSQFCPSYDGGLWQFYELSNVSVRRTRVDGARPDQCARTTGRQ
jgi:hypothetical protein